MIFFSYWSQSVPCITFTFAVLLVKAHSTKMISNLGSKILRIWVQVFIDFSLHHPACLSQRADHAAGLNWDSVSSMDSEEGKEGLSGRSWCSGAEGGTSEVCEAWFGYLWWSGWHRLSLTLCCPSSSPLGSSVLYPPSWSRCWAVHCLLSAALCLCESLVTFFFLFVYFVYF